MRKGSHEALADDADGDGAGAPVSGRPAAKLISMWSGPRNVSTALMYSFRQRSDTQVVDEPFYGHYLRNTDADHPATGEVIGQMEGDSEVVLRLLRERAGERPVLFIKNMAHHLSGLDDRYLEGFRNALLTRDPREMLPSLARVLEQPRMRDTGLEQQLRILEFELAAGREPVVLDARELLLDPRGVLAEACEKLGLPFDESMLAWPPGPKPEDGIWAPHWYDSVHRSTGFAPYRPPSEEFPRELEGLLEECLPYYERLAQSSIRADVQRPG